MIVARLAYLTSPAPNHFILNYQVDGDDIVQIEISKAHLANVLIDGLSFSLRETSISRVPNPQTENANGDDRRQQPA